MRRITEYFKQVVIEAKKVSWPTRKQTYDLTMVVIIASLVVALYIGALDFVFQKFITFIL